MRNIQMFIAIFFGAVIFSGCRKDKYSFKNCIPQSSTVRQINNAHATIQINAGQYYIVEAGTTDTRLKPCDLPTEFQVNNLDVIVSGDVKLTKMDGMTPCCTYDFVITGISK